MAITTNAAFILSVILSTSVVLAQDAAEGEELTAEELTLDRESVRCISAAAIRETTAIDDQTIIFRLRNGDYYVNALDIGCDSLARRNRISFSTPSGRLCSGNMISVVRSFSGPSTSSVGCGLRRFFPITELEAKRLSGEEIERSDQPQVEVENPNEE